MVNCPIVLAAALLRFLDPVTSVYQTDDAREGASLSSRPGYWPVPQGLADPLAEKLRPRVVHACFSVSETPFPDYDPQKPSPLFKVNQVGYLPDAPKFAYAGAWLGPALGPWKPHAPMDAFELVRVGQGGGEVVLTGRPAIRVQDATTKEGTPFTGEDTYEMDFSSVTNAGMYFVRIPGVGRSADFRIAASAAEDAFRVHMLGLYHKRCGIEKREPYTHWTGGACHTNVVRGTFPPEEGTLSPKVRWFDIIRDNTDWEHGERVALSGGWHDAADYDRRPQHLNIVNDLCAVYLMRPGNFRDGQLSIPENANGIPDILDEAEWGLRHLLAAQQKDGSVGTWVESVGHPGPGNVAALDEMPYAISRPTLRSSLMYAAHASLLARCHPSFRSKYLESAKRAFDYAMMRTTRQEDIFVIHQKRGRFIKHTEDEYVNWSEDGELSAAYLVKASLNLYALTGNERFLTRAQKEMPRLLEDVKSKAWNWPPLLFAGERALGAPPDALGEFISRWERRTLNVANEIMEQVAGAYAYRAPWWAPQKGWVNAMSWGNSHPLRRAQYLVAAHGITGDAKYLDAASLANDFHNGCNPQGTTLTSGLGEVYPVAFLDLPSYVDGIAEFVPGITPYRWNYGMPPKAVEMVFGGDKARASKWPIWRRWGNLENQTVAASEYTVWETIAPAASVTGYLIDPAATTPLGPLPKPAQRLSDLPGYWLLP